MRSFQIILLLSAVFFMPFISYGQQAAPPQEVVVLNPEDPLPDSAVYLDKVNVVDKGFKIKCTYEQTLLEAKEKTVREKGNLLKVSKWITPSAMSTCYGIRGAAYYVPDIGVLKARQAAREDSAMRSLVPDTADFAMLYIYRPSGYGFAISYNIHFGDSVICRVHNNSYFAIPIRRQGPTTIWTRTEARAEVPVDVVFGKAYFLKCGVTMGAVVGRPSMTFVNPAKAIHEFRFDKTEESSQSLPARKSYQD